LTDFVVTHAQMLDPAASELRPGASIRVERDRIVEVAEDGTSLCPPEGVVVIEAGGRTLMPGLIDAHVHAAITTMDLAAMARRSPARVGIEATAILERMLRRGFTTVRDAGGLDVGVQERLRAGPRHRAASSGRAAGRSLATRELAPARRRHERSPVSDAVPARASIHGG
jgi:imidazolonepropionase-like amidohydrolase